MPVHTNTIDAYEFEDIRGSLQPRSEELEVFSRPGLDDTTVRLTGVRGRPTQIQTMHYVADFTAAKNAISAYVQLKDGSGYEIVQHSVSFGDFRILDVVELQARAVTNVTGSLIASPTVMQVCLWTVQHQPAL
jgi:hypothetical protein